MGKSHSDNHKQIFFLNKHLKWQVINQCQSHIPWILQINRNSSSEVLKKNLDFYLNQEKARRHIGSSVTYNLSNTLKTINAASSRNSFLTQIFYLKSQRWGFPGNLFDLQLSWSSSSCFWSLILSFLLCFFTVSNHAHQFTSVVKTKWHWRA